MPTPKNKLTIDGKELVYSTVPSTGEERWIDFSDSKDFDGTTGYRWYDSAGNRMNYTKYQEADAQESIPTAEEVDSYIQSRGYDPNLTRPMWGLHQMQEQGLQGVYPEFALLTGGRGLFNGALQNTYTALKPYASQAWQGLKPGGSVWSTYQKPLTQFAESMMLGEAANEAARINGYSGWGDATASGIESLTGYRPNETLMSFTNPFYLGREMPQLFKPFTQVSRGLWDRGNIIDSFNKANALENYTIPFQAENRPGYQLRSLMSGNALEKQLSKKGTISINNIKAHINKGSNVEKAVVDKVLSSEQFAGQKVIDYNDFKRAVQDELITYDRIPSKEWADYGFTRLGYKNPDQATKEWDIAFNELMRIYPYRRDGELIQATNEIMGHKKDIANLNTYTFESPRIPIGNAKHYNPNTLGHSRTYTTKDEPDILHVMESQSDWAQNYGKTPKFKVSENGRTNVVFDEDAVTWKAVNDGTGIEYSEIKDDPSIMEHLNNVFTGYDSTPQSDYLASNYLQRQLQENLKYAAEHGQTKMRYPTAETAAKIEGYSEKYLPEDESKARTLEDAIFMLKLKNSKLSDLDGFGLSDNLVFDYSEPKEQVMERFQKELDVLQARKAYLPEHQTILKKYASFPKQYSKLYKGAEVRTVTDSKGNTWYEVDVPKDYLNQEWQYAYGGPLVAQANMFKIGGPKKQIVPGNLPPYFSYNREGNEYISDYWSDEMDAPDLEWWHSKAAKELKKTHRQVIDPEGGQIKYVPIDVYKAGSWKAQGRPNPLYEELGSSSIYTNPFENEEVIDGKIVTPIEGAKAPDGQQLYEDENGETYTKYELWDSRAQFSEGGSLNTYKQWQDLPIKERADIMKVAIRNGITNLADIKAKYNEFALGGQLEEPNLYRGGGTKNLLSGAYQKLNRINQLQAVGMTPQEAHAMQYYVDRGFAPHQAAGFVGGFVRESALDPTALNKNSGAYGIGQWLGPRKDALMKMYGNNPTFANELDYSMYELDNTTKEAKRRILSSSTPEEAATNAFNYYGAALDGNGIANMNRWGQDGQKSLQQGIDNAKRLYNLYSSVGFSDGGNMYSKGSWLRKKTAAISKASKVPTISKKSTPMSNSSAYAMQYFINKGLAPHQAAGLVGNLMRESGLNPLAINPGSKAYGIAQWLGARKKKLFSMYGSKPTLQNQLDFVWWELNNTHKNGLKYLMAARNAEEAARAGMNWFEFSNGDAISEMNKWGQDGRGSMRKGIEFATKLAGQPMPDLAYLDTPNLNMQQSQTYGQMPMGYGYPMQQPQNDNNTFLAFEPSNPQAFFAPLSSYERPVGQTAAQPLVDAAEQQYKAEMAERQRVMRQNNNMLALVGYLNNSGSQDSSPFGVFNLLANNPLTSTDNVSAYGGHLYDGESEPTNWMHGVNPRYLSEQVTVEGRNAKVLGADYGRNTATVQYDDGTTETVRPAKDFWTVPNNVVLGSKELKDNQYRTMPTNSEANAFADAWTEQTAPTIGDLVTAGTKGFDLFMPHKYVGLLDSDNKNGFLHLFDGDNKGLFINDNPNGMFSKRYAEEHPYWAMAGNMVGDAAAGYGISKTLGAVGDVYNVGKTAIATSTNPNMQYVRYGLGKINSWVHGYNPKLPTLYRKVKGMPTLRDGKIIISTPENRFAYENGLGQESPLVTNFTSDVGVRCHPDGNWNWAPTLAMPGESLLGKNVISTRPSDTFTFGDMISVPAKKVTAITGRQKELDYFKDLGIKTLTSPESQSSFGEDLATYMADVRKARARNARILERKKMGYLTPKRKSPEKDFNNYASEIQKVTRTNFRNPTIKDYEFMDYVFNPQYTSEVVPNMDITEAVTLYPSLVGSWFGNSGRRTYIANPDEWVNVMYDPYSPAEALFRKSKGIDLKPEWQNK